MTPIEIGLDGLLELSLVEIKNVTIKLVLITYMVLPITNYM